MTKKNPIEQFLDELEDQLLKSLKPTPEKEDGETEADTAPEDAPETSVIDTDLLISEAVRILKRAEELAGTSLTSQGMSYSDPASEQLIKIADRYIRLTELVAVYGE